MAENADVEVTIPTLTRSCVERFNFVGTFYPQDRDSRILILRLRIEATRLFEWPSSLFGHQTFGPHVTENDLQLSVKIILELLMGLLDESEQSRLRYGYKAYTAAQLTALTIHDKEKFTNLISEARGLIDRLYDTTKQWFSPQKQRKTLCSRLCSTKDVAMLENIVEACKVDYPSVSDAVSKHLDSLRPDKGPRPTILDLTQKQENAAEYGMAENSASVNTESLENEELKGHPKSSDDGKVQQAVVTESPSTDAALSEPSKTIEKQPEIVARPPLTWRNMALDLRTSYASSVSALRDSNVSAGQIEIESNYLQEDEIQRRVELMNNAAIGLEIRLTPQTKNLMSWLSHMEIYDRTTEQNPNAGRSALKVKVLEGIVDAYREGDFKDELDAIMQWFSVLSEGERAASFGRMIHKLTPDQLKFFAGLISSYEKDVAEGVARNIQ